MGGSANIQSPRRRIVRFAVVAILAAWALSTVLPELTVFWRQFGNFGFTNSFLSIDGIEPGSAAEVAGLAVGDTIVWRALTFEDRVALDGYPTPGQKLSLPVVRDGHRRTLFLTAQQRRFEPMVKVSVVLDVISGFLFISIGVLLVLLRPSLVTWSFFVFAVSTSGTDPFVVSQLPAGLAAIDVVLLRSTWGPIAASLLVFAATFPAPTASRLSAWAVRCAPYVAFLIGGLYAYLALLNVYPGLDNIPDATWIKLFKIGQVAFALSYFAAGVFFAVTFFQRRGLERERVKWVLLAFGATLILGFVPYSVEVLFAVNFPDWFGLVFGLLYATIPLAVAYAVLRHRVIDVTFFISRVLVAGVLTSVLVAVFTLIDLIFVRTLGASNLALAIEIVVALALGFWLNGIHRNLDRLIDSLIFRQRYIGKTRLDRAAAALAHADSVHTINGYLVREPVDALALTSGALFIRGDDERFLREASFGWPDGAIQTFPNDDRLALSLAAEQSPLRVLDVDWRPPGLPDGVLAPVLAVPVLVRRRLKAIALYGPHTNGADLDADEIQSLSRLAQAASASYDHLEAESLRTLVNEQRKEIDALRVAEAGY